MAQPLAVHTQLISGEGCLAEIKDLADGRVFVVTDSGLVAAGHAAKLETLLSAGAHEVHRFDAVKENPDEANVDACLAEYRRCSGDGDADWIVALGGGSSIDVAKGCSTLAARGGRMRDYLGRKTDEIAQPKVIAIPTTAGTGSEVQSFALIGNDDTGRKMACGGDAPAFALLDPDLTASQPDFVKRCAGLDTLAHAVETAVTKDRTPATLQYAFEAFRLVERNFETTLENDDVTARSAMLRASAAAGIAIENSMLGAAHSMANPLTRQFGVVHGQAVGQTLPHVVRFNAEDAGAAAVYAEMACDAGVAERSDSRDAAVKKLVARLKQLVKAAGFGPAIAGVTHDAVDALANEAAEQWTAQFNPRSVAVDDFQGLFRQVIA